MLPHWSRDRGEVVAYEQVTLFGLAIVSRRPVSYGPVNPDEASEIFIRSALVEADMKRPFPFLLHNQRVIEQVARMEDKIRRRNLLAGEEELARFYQERLPGIYDARSLQKLIRDKGSDKFLRMREEDILARIPEEDEFAHYPDDVHLAGHRFTCDYHYEPGHPKDGVTVKVPLHMISTVPAASADWNNWRHEKQAVDFIKPCQRWKGRAAKKITRCETREHDECSRKRHCGEENPVAMRPAFRPVPNQCHGICPAKSRLVAVPRDHVGLLPRPC